MKNTHGKKFGFLRGAWLLTAAALASKLIGGFYRIPLTRALGAHGMGLYQSVFPTYALIVTLTGGGLTAAVSKLTAESDGKTDCAALAAVAVGISLPVTFSAAAFAPLIASLSGAPEATGALWTLLASVPLSAVCSVMRGYFLGTANVRPSAFGQLLEQTVKLAAGLTLAVLLAKHSLTAAVAGCAAGVSLAEAASAAYYFYARKRTVAKKDNCEQSLSAGECGEKQNAVALAEVSEELAPAMDMQGGSAALPAVAAADAATVSGGKLQAFLTSAALLVKASLPITLGLIILPLCQVADSFTVVNILTASGEARETATALYGIVTGPVGSLVNMPAVLTVGLCGTLLPKVSQLCGKGEKIGSTAFRAVAFAAALGLAAFAGLGLFAPLVLKILYGNSLGVEIASAARLLRISAFAVPAVATLQTAAAVLQGAGKAYIPAFNLFAAAAVKEILNFVLIPHFGIAGFAVSNAAFYLLACAADLVSLAVFIRKRAKR